MGDDLGNGTVTGLDRKTGFPVDQWGHILSPFDERDGSLIDFSHGTVLRNTTNPYGFLEYAVGSGDDFHCFDYHIINAGVKGLFIILDSVLNSETGSFIQGDGYWILPINTTEERKRAVATALSIVDGACDWAAENEVRVTKRGWNQDYMYFVRSVAQSLFPYKMEGFSARQMRFGGKKIDAVMKDILKGVKVVPRYAMEDQ